jgi:hypothetical protein
VSDFCVRMVTCVFPNLSCIVPLPPLFFLSPLFHVRSHRLTHTLALTHPQTRAQHITHGFPADRTCFIVPYRSLHAPRPFLSNFRLSAHVLRAVYVHTAKCVYSICVLIRGAERPLGAAPLNPPQHSLSTVSLVPIVLSHAQLPARSFLRAHCWIFYIQVHMHITYQIYVCFPSRKEKILSHELILCLAIFNLFHLSIHLLSDSYAVRYTVVNYIICILILIMTVLPFQIM